MDFSAFETEQSQGDINTVRKLAEELRDIETQINELEETTKLLKKRGDELRFEEIPDAMGDLGMERIALADGFTVKIGDLVTGSLPKDPEKRKRALELIDSYDASSLCKNVVSMEFGRSEHNQALSLAAELREQGHKADVKTDIHHSTLCSFVRERMKKGEPVDAEALGVFVRRKAETSFGDGR